MENPDKKTEQEKPQPLRCPHCKKEIEKIEFRNFGDGKAWLIGCPFCMKVIAGTMTK